MPSCQIEAEPQEGLVALEEAIDAQREAALAEFVEACQQLGWRLCLESIEAWTEQQLNTQGDLG